MRNPKFFAVVLLAFFMIGCKTQQPTVVTLTEYRDRVKTDTVTLTALQVDSIYLSHVEKQKGDTVHVRDTIFKYKILHDTQTEIKTEYVHDSIPYACPVEIVKKVRERNGYDRFTSWGFWILFVLLLLRVAWWAFKTFYLRR